MRIRFLCAFFCLFNALNGNSQGFYKTYLEGNNLSVGRIVPQANGYQLWAYEDDLTHDLLNFAVLRLGPDGTLKSHSQYEIQNPDEDYVIQTLDSNFVFAGLSANGLPSLTKKTADGTVLWSKEYELPGTLPTGGVLVAERENGELYLACIDARFNPIAQPSYRVLVVRATPEGDVIYSKAIDFNGQEFMVVNKLLYLVAAADGGCYIASQVHTAVAQVLMKLNPTGDKVYHKTMVNAGAPSGGIAFNIMPGEGGTCTFAFYNYTYGPQQLPWSYTLGALSTNGNYDWFISPKDLLPFGNLPPNERYATIQAVGAVPVGGFIFAGYFGQSVAGNAVNGQFYVMQLHADGSLDWMKTDYDSLPAARTVKATEGGCILFGGKAVVSNNPFVGGTWMMRTDQFGELDGAPTQQTNIQASICEGEQYVVGDSSFMATGTYTIPFISTDGCDSVVVLALDVMPKDSTVLNLDLCQGEVGPLSDTFYGIPGEFIEQAVFTNQIGCDSTVTAYISVHPEELLWADNGPLPYGMVYHGVVLTQDTQFVSYDTTEFGCLLTISENVTVGPSASSDLENSLGLYVSPNPFTNKIQLDFKLPERIMLNATLFDPLGRQAAVLLENEALEAGEHHLDLRAKDLSPGLYHLRIQAGEAIHFQKLIKS
jgi:hypothetical protein